MRRLFLPLALLLSAFAIAQDVVGTWPRAWIQPTACRLVFAVVLLLAWRFRRGRSAWAALAWGLASEALLIFDAVSRQPQRGALLIFVGMALAVGLATLPWMREWRVLSRAGLWRFAALAMFAAAVWMGTTSADPKLVMLRDALTAPWLALPWDVPGLTSWAGVPLPRALFLAWGASLLSLGTATVRRRDGFLMGLWALWGATTLALFGAWQQITTDRFADAAMIYWLVSGLILATSLIDSTFSLAFEDGLTGLPARRALEESLVHLGSQYTLAMVDIDHFKKFNDRHGHEVGDQVLRMVAETLRKVGGGGQVFRYGGEEFTVLFVGRDLADAEPHLEALRRAIAERRFAVRSPNRPQSKGKQAAKGRGRGAQGKNVPEKNVRVTVSLGAAQRSARLKTPEEVMKAADKALYRSKRKGRNRLTLGK